MMVGRIQVESDNSKSAAARRCMDLDRCLRALTALEAYSPTSYIFGAHSPVLLALLQLRG
jgi:hypothetical protein